MLRNIRRFVHRKTSVPVLSLDRSFLTADYKCIEQWKSVKISPIINKINLNDFYNQLDQTFASKGVISAIDVDIFAHAVKDDPHHLEELKELLHKLRLSAETDKMLESTHYATVRNYMAQGHIEELIEILRDPLNFGVFLDDFTANMLLDELLVANKYELAADVASFVMLQEEYNNELTGALCQYAAYKYIQNYVPTEPKPPVNTKTEVEEIKIRVKFLRNPYYDDHFDIKETITRSGKVLAWLSQVKSDNLNNNLQLIGWLKYKKYDKLLELSKELSKSTSFKLYGDVLELLKKENVEHEPSQLLVQNCVSILQNIQKADIPLEKSIENSIENAINKVQHKDIETQQKLFKHWETNREQKLYEKTSLLDRAKRLQFIQDKQMELKEEEQKLWFFENEDQIDLQIEEKEKLQQTSYTKKKSHSDDEDYIPPEIIPKRK